MVASDILPPNTHLVGLWLQLLCGGRSCPLSPSSLPFFVRGYVCILTPPNWPQLGAYFAYLPQCVFVLRPKVRNGLSIWLPIACAVMFLIVTAVRPSVHTSYR